ncbi:MAG TPA: hypothetical protein VHF89_03965 [Solirubrobacteraceae bacterium]|nr:hypothetical protein [Solirubrobacteraceae bacterium]
MRARAAAAALALAGCGGGSDEAPPAAPPAPLGVAYVQHADGTFDSFLSRFDPAKLAPQGPRAHVGEFHDAWSFSPDRRQVALGQGGQGLGIHVYDLERMREVRAIRTGIAAEALAWLRPRRAVALLQSAEVVAVDPTTGDVLRRRRPRGVRAVCFGGSNSAAATRRGLAVLVPVAPRLLLIDAGGRPHAARLPQGIWRCGGLAIDAAGDRALVVSRAALVAEVDLATMRVRAHRVRGLPRSLGSHGAAWLGDGTLLAARGSSGVWAIDTRTWTSRVLDRRAEAARPAGDVVLAYDGDRLALPRGRGTGLAAYEPGGRRRYRVLRGRQVEDVQVAGARAYALAEGTLYGIDVATGRIAGRRGGLTPGTRIDLLD